MLTSITGGPGGGAVTFTPDTIKGIEYAFFSAAAGNYTYTATYAADTEPPRVASTSPTNGATGVSLGARVTATFSEPMDATTITATTFELRDASNTLVPATVSYNDSTRTATLTPSANLVGSTTYSATVKSGANGVKDLAGNALSNPPGDLDFSWSFTTEL